MTNMPWKYPELWNKPEPKPEPKPARRWTRKLHANEVRNLSRVQKKSYMTWWYQKVLRGNFRTQSAVIEVYFHKRFDIEETAKILDRTVDEVKFAVDIAKQNAR